MSCYIEQNYFNCTTFLMWITSGGNTDFAQKTNYRERKTPCEAPGVAPVGLPGVFSILRASSPWIEPGDLPLLMEVMPARTAFPPRKTRGSAERDGQAPNRRVNASGVVASRSDPDCQRCALASLTVGPGWPSLRDLAPLVSNVGAALG